MKVPWSNLFHPPPAPPAFGAGKVLPEQEASWLSRLTFWWMGPFLDVGFSRALEKEDFWELPQSRHTETLTSDVEHNFFTRCPPEKRPLFMRDGTDVDNASDTPRGKGTDVEQQDGANSPSPALNYDESLFKALFVTFKLRIVGSGLLLLVADTLRTTSPLVSKVFITWLTESYLFFHLTPEERAALEAAGFGSPRGVGYGIGIAFAIFVMQEVSSVLSNHFTLAAMTTGVYARTSVIGNIFRKSLRLSGKARTKHSVGQITTLISADASRLDALSFLGHYVWESPVQIAIAVGLLIGLLGVSALVGVAVLIIGLPLQFVLIVIIFTQQKECLKITDKRVRLTTEVLHGIRLIKAYGWEGFYIHQITLLREQEVKRIRKTSIASALLIATFYFVPVFATVLTFVTYSLTGHDLNVAKIFAGLQLFNVLRAPLILFPFVLSTIAEASVSLGRLVEFLTAEELGEPYTIDSNQESAISVDGDFQWEVVPKLPDPNEKKLNDTEKKIKEYEEKKAKKLEEKKRRKEEKNRKKSGQAMDGDYGSTSQGLPVSMADVAEDTSKADDQVEQPFALTGLSLTIPKGAFVAIVGRVGSGKSSILQALIGEMRRTRGEVFFGGSVSYVPQTPWIKNATVKDNILFGEEDDEKRFQQTIEACSLKHDLTVLPYGVNTQIGEKGINLSGGQKARVSLARAAYSKSDIVLLDDPLSAVDSYVGKDILENCLLRGPLAGRTRVLVTHAIHALDKTDYIYVMDQGRILEEGTYEDLIDNGKEFARIIHEYGNTSKADQSVATRNVGQQLIAKDKSSELDDALMQAEERNTGAVTLDIYKKYLRNAGGLRWAPIILILLILVEANNVATTLFLGFWSGNTIHHFSQAEYMAVYAALGVSLAILTFAVTYGFVISGLIASLNLYKGALSSVICSPVSFFDTTPIGRIVSRLSKDQDVIDSALPHLFLQFTSILFSVFGTIGLVFYAFPYLGIIFLPLTILYYAASVYYRRSSVETKRLDSLLRSILYSSYSETLTGLSTIRAYGEQGRAIKAAEHGLDMENRAYLMTVVMQRWLAIRLEFFANILVLGIGLFGAGLRHSVSPSRISVVLTYTLGATQVFAELISIFAQCEQGMNAVERVLHYKELPAEGSAARRSLTNEIPSEWPTHGSVSFRDVDFRYRDGLPLVLKAVSFDVKAGEKIGVVGRTGSGKSSLIQALLRMVELVNGNITIDDIDISSVPFDTLRTRLAFVPQDTTLFLGTLRNNLDPQCLRTDAELISILQRASLLPSSGPIDPVVEAKFSLDSAVTDEGSNYSAGEKQLLALCRALVKRSRIIILDEATSSVDAETDAKIQKTIQTEFMTSTLLCIAHRLNTIAHYDRIIVMDDGKVAEFDTVLGLYDNAASIFRSLCDEANLDRADIIKIRKEHGAPMTTS